MFIKRHWWPVVYGVLLAAFTLYLAMDTFVIKRVYTVVPQAEHSPSPSPAATPESASAAPAENPAQTPAPSPAATPIVTENSYTDEDISLTITQYRQHDTQIYVADVRLSCAEYLKTAFAQSAYGRNVTATTSETARSVGALFAINGDYYGAREQGYVIRNGVLYRDAGSSGQQSLVIYEQGDLGIITEGEVSAEQLLSQGAMHVLSFGPALVIDGEISVSKNDEVGKAMASNPRTAIGIIDELHYVFVVSDGRTQESAGLSLMQLAQFMAGLGVRTAYNLDGGGSSTMYFNGSVVNNPTTNGSRIRERSVSDIVYIGH